ncbi:MAG TPA: ATP-grasp domain-containing protein [Gemmata sp.]
MTAPSILVLYNEPVLALDHPDANSEHDIYDTVNDAFKTLSAAGFVTTKLGINRDPQPLLDALKQNRPDAVFNLFEGIATQTSTEVSAAALLEWLNVPFTGCPAAALALGRDKVRTKHILAASGVPTPDYLIIDELPVPAWNRDWPAIVKPAYQDASVGIEQRSVVTSQAQLEAQVAHTLATYGPPVVVERYIKGREFHVNMVEPFGGSANGPVVLPATEIAFQKDEPGRWAVYTFTAKWHDQSDEYKGAPLKFPVELPERDFARLAQIAARSFRALGCRDYARVDVRMDAAGGFHVLEVNPNPYLNSITLVDGLRAVGSSYERCVVELALSALARDGISAPAGTITVPHGLIAGGTN